MSYDQPSGEPLLWSPAASPQPHCRDAHWVGGRMEVGNWESFWAQKTAQQYEIQRVMSSVLWGQFFLMSWPKIRRRGGCVGGRVAPWWGCGQAETMVEGWELQGGPAASSMEIGVVTPQSVHGSPSLFPELKCSHFRLCMYLTFFFPSQ